MKIFFLIISFFLFNFLIFSQSDSLHSSSFSFNDVQGTGFVESNQKVSMAGTIALSFMFPGTGLFLSENYGAAAAYLGVGSAFYVSGLVFLLSGESPNEDVALPFFLAGGFIHLASIIHTFLATREYNNNIIPSVTYNGRVYQVGLSINF